MKITGNFRPVPLQTSKYFNVCWTKLEPDDLEYRHFAENPGFSYSEAEATIAGVFNLLAYVYIEMLWRYHLERFSNCCNIKK